MTRILSGVRVVEVATWLFVPAAGAVLADLGADVIKIEHPEKGDPHRAFTGAVAESGHLNVSMELANRGKRSVGLDLTTDDGRELLYRLVETADVFTTNLTPSGRKKIGIEPEQIRQRNPRIVYVRGSGYGPKGSDSDRPSYDGDSSWSRASVGHFLKPGGEQWPLSGTAAFGDLSGAAYLAGSILGGLFHRERTGEAPIVDVSLFGVGLWTMAPGIATTEAYDLDDMPRPPRADKPNPVANYFRTSDGRFVRLSMMQSDRFSTGLCSALAAPELARDPRFVDFSARDKHRAECTEALDEIIGRYTLAQLSDRLNRQPGPWGVVQTPREVNGDPQALANGYFSDLVDEDGYRCRVVASPFQYDEEATGPLPPAPRHGQHTEAVLAELGLDWDQIVGHKVSGAVL